MDPEQSASMAPHVASQCPATIDRRSCVRLFISLLGVLSLGPASGASEGSLAAAQLETWLQRIGPDRLGDAAALSRLGAIYLAAHPAEQQPEHLSRLILGDSAAPVESVLIERIAQDWSQHDVTQVEGWVLSRTEARICAAVHLLGR
jgi:hypothetical protein